MVNLHRPFRREAGGLWHFWQEVTPEMIHLVLLARMCRHQVGLLTYAPFSAH